LSIKKGKLVNTDKIVYHNILVLMKGRFRFRNLIICCSQQGVFHKKPPATGREADGHIDLN